MNRQFKLLLLLAVMLVGALIYAYYWYPRQESVDGEIDFLRLQPREEQRSQAQGGLAGLKLDFGKRDVAPFKAPKRDIFSPLYVEKKVKKKMTKPKPVVKAKPVEKPKIVITPKLPNTKPLVNFTLLGYLDKEGIRTVFLAQKEEIYILKAGDSFANDYKVAEVTADSLLIRRETDNRDIRINIDKPNQ